MVAQRHLAPHVRLLGRRLRGVRRDRLHDRVRPLRVVGRRHHHRLRGRLRALRPPVAPAAAAPRHHLAAGVPQDPLQRADATGAGLVGRGPQGLRRRGQVGGQRDPAPGLRGRAARAGHPHRRWRHARLLHHRWPLGRRPHRLRAVRHPARRRSGHVRHHGGEGRHRLRHLGPAAPLARAAVRRQLHASRSSSATRSSRRSPTTAARGTSPSASSRHRPVPRPGARSCCPARSTSSGPSSSSSRCGRRRSSSPAWPSPTSRTHCWPRPCCPPASSASSSPACSRTPWP